MVRGERERVRKKLSSKVSGRRENRFRKGKSRSRCYATWMRGAGLFLLAKCMCVVFWGRVSASLTVYMFFSRHQGLRSSQHYASHDKETVHHHHKDGRALPLRFLSFIFWLWRKAAIRDLSIVVHSCLLSSSPSSTFFSSSLSRVFFIRKEILPSFRASNHVYRGAVYRCC